MSFVPIKGQHYYMINSRFAVARATHNGSQKSTERIAGGNAFKKYSHAQEALETLKRASHRVNKSWWEFWK